MVLKDMGAEVQVAYGGRKGPKILDASYPAVVLLDIGMTGMNGFEVARAIRARRSDHEPVLFALTGWVKKRIVGVRRKPGSIATS